LNSDSSNILPDNYTIDLEMPPQHNLDKEVNEQGKNLIDLCIETKLRILNGRVDGDSLTYNTCYSSRGSSSVDYFLASEDIFHDFIFLHVFQPNELSDHNVLWAGLQNICNYNLNSENTECNYEILPGKFSLETGSREDFVTALEENKSSTMLNQFFT
jgi:hypothetical protein